MWVGLGKPIRACHDHVHVLNCPERCLGVELGEVEELQSAAHDGCAVCRLPDYTHRSFRVLRKCPNRRCYGRFRRVPYDDTAIDEWVDVARARVRRLLRRAA